MKISQNGHFLNIKNVDYVACCFISKPFATYVNNFILGKKNVNQSARDLKRNNREFKKGIKKMLKL